MPSSREPISVFTALFGGGLELPEPEVDAPGVRFVAFTDDAAIASSRWEVRHVPSDPRTTPRRQAKRYKVLPHEPFPEARYTLWLDATVALTLDPWILVERHLGDADVALFPHPWRDCLYAEAEACIAQGDDSPEVVRQQVERYRRDGYPARNGLAVCGIILRRHTPAVRRLDEAWWSEIERGSVRDQLSFDYVCWRLGIRYATFPGTCFENAFLRYRPQPTIPEPERLRARAEPATRT